MIRDNFLKKPREYNNPHFGITASGVVKSKISKIQYHESSVFTNTYYESFEYGGGSEAYIKDTDETTWAGVWTVSGSSSYRDNGNIVFTWAENKGGSLVITKNIDPAYLNGTGEWYYMPTSTGSWVNLNINMTGTKTTHTLTGLSPFTKVKYVQDSSSGWVVGYIYTMYRI